MQQHGSVFVELAVARLEFSFEAHSKVEQVDDLPGFQLPKSVHLPAVGDTDDEVAGIIEDLVRRPLGLEVESAKAAVFAAAFINFWVDVKNAPALDVPQKEIGIAGALGLAGSGERDAAFIDAFQIEVGQQVVFDMPADFVHPADLVDRVAGFGQISEHCAEGRFEMRQHGCVHYIRGHDWQHCASGNRLRNFGEADAIKPFPVL